MRFTSFMGRIPFSVFLLSALAIQNKSQAVIQKEKYTERIAFKLIANVEMEELHHAFAGGFYIFRSRSQ